jgi:2-polyprenyl-3-methyl-5-hydroxy-6-metoxy-1,4-benzoquinol methylase
MNQALQEFRDHLRKSLFSVLGDSIETLQTEFGDAYSDDFAEHLGLLQQAFPDKPWPKWAVDGYIRFNKEILREERSFLESGEYAAQPEDFDRIVEETYDNAEIMERFYLVGLYCSYFIWPHHYEVLSFYRNSFLGVGDSEPATIAEWGSGHGLYSLEAMRRWPQAHAALADISSHSLNFSKELLAAAGVADRCSYRLGDVTASPNETPVDRLICGELLEHVPDPGRLLGQIRASLKPGGIAYLTGAVNAAQSDHVYLFRSPEDVTKLVEAHGFQIRDQLAVSHPNRSADQDPPQVVAMLAQTVG